MMIARGAEANPSCFRAKSLPPAPPSSAPLPLPTPIDSLPSAAASPRASSAAEPDLADPILEIIPTLLRLSLATGNPWGNTKYIIQSLSLTTTSPSYSGRSKAERNGFKQAMTRCKSTEEACRVCGMEEVEIGEWKVGKRAVGELVPSWEKRRRGIEGEKQ